MKVGILGLGLIGGSFAKALHRISSHTVLGFDTNESTMEAALAEGIIQEELNQENIKSCELILLAVRPGAAVDFVKKNKENIRGTLLDLCGVKRVLEEEILPLAKEYQFSYLGGHPMAGRERGGYDRSLPELYDKASMIFVENETSKGLGKRLEPLFREIGFKKIVYSNSCEHDRIIAYTSQLAHVVSNSYVQSPSHNEEYGFSADSLRDLTRVATLDAEMWTELFFKNKDNLCREIRRISSQLESYADAIEKEEEEMLKEMLHAGCAAKKEMEDKRR
ncbi:prephenate dehydrogenase [Gallicola sp. Sow4_E12]|uniref:prephenate dehydrogenase n=1 Tax=Gallicola sp. Sow4_E12 TaxID=3438785 RepID=UPI003F8F1EA4